MKNFKKNPIFFTILYAFLLAFAVMLAYNVFHYVSLSSAKADYAKAEKQYKRVQSQDPSEASVKASLANIEEIDAKLKGLVAELSPGSSDIISEAPMKEGYLFVEDLRGAINKLRADAQALSISLNPQEAFGYASYYKSGSTPPPNKAVENLWKQASVLKYIVGKLYAAKEEAVPMQIDLVQREVLPEEAAVAESTEKKSTSRFASRRTPSKRKGAEAQDTFAIDKILSAKVEGSIDTFAFKFTFRTKTDVLRNFLNSLKDFDLMLVVRSVEVSAGKPIAEMKLDDDDRPSKTLTAEELAIEEMNKINKPVIDDNISEFTVTIEYVELSKDPIAPKAETEEEE